MIGADALLAALAAADEALARQDPHAAATALANADRACRDLQAAGEQLAPETLARARNLHARGAGVANAARQRLARDLDQAGSARRAVAAYRR